MAYLYSGSSTASSSYAVSGVHVLRSSSNSVLPLKLSFAGVLLKSKGGKRVNPLRVSSNDSSGQFSIRNHAEYWGNARQFGHWDYEQSQHADVLEQISTKGGDSISTRVAPVPQRVGPKPRVILIAGPTAVGKTRLSIELAKTLDGEIINADSVQVYHGLDVGAGKAPISERQGIPHHLIDVVPPTRDYTYTEFLVAARAATEHILAKGKVPIVVGGTGIGTGMNMRWYMHNRRDLTPELDTGLDAVLNAGLDAHPDWDYDFQCYFLYLHCADLYPRVDIRCEQMTPALLAETSWLMDQRVEPNSTPAAKVIGYDEAMQLLLDARENDGYVSQQRFMRFLGDLQRNSKELVRKQIAWFRSESLSEVREFKWLAADASVAAMVDRLTEEYRRAPGEVSGVSWGRDLKNASRLEQRRLKDYEAALRVYTDPAAVASCLAWIKNTQCKQLPILL